MTDFCRNTPCVSFFSRLPYVVIACFSGMGSVMSALKDIDLNLLIALDALLAYKSVSLAAEKLGKTQSALSHTLRKLRLLFKDQILERHGNELLPTPLAKILQCELNQLMNQMQSFFYVGECERPISQISRSFNVSLPDWLEWQLAEKLIQYVCQYSPHVKINFANYGKDADRVLKENVIDCALGMRFEENEWLRSEELVKSPYVALFYPSFFPEVEEAFTVAQLQKVSYCDIAPRILKMSTVDNAFKNSGITRKVICSSQSFLSTAVITCKVPQVVILPEVIALSLLPFAPELKIASLPFKTPSFVVEICWNRNCDEDEVLFWFRAMIRRSLILKNIVES